MTKILTIIPARANSKGVPGKNKMKLNGVSLVKHAYNIATKSKFNLDIVLSTDDDEIINNFKNIDININRRKHSLSTDDSPVSDTINFILGDSKEYDFILLLQPTSPIRSTLDIDNCISMLLNMPDINTVISVCEMNDIHPGRMYWPVDNMMEPIINEFEETRRQDNKSVLLRNGAIYLTRANSFKINNSMMSKPISPYIMNSEFLLNIDSNRDKLIAETIFNYWLENDK